MTKMFSDEYIELCEKRSVLEGSGPWAQEVPEDAEAMKDALELEEE